MSEQKDSRPKPRVIGPATLVALASIVVIAYYNYARIQPVKLINSNNAAHADFKIPNEPDTARLINARDKLSLSSNQIAELGKILADWQAQSAPSIAKMRTAYDNMGKFLNAPPKKPPAMLDIMMKAGPLSDATAEYIKMKDAFQTRAIAILTPEQKEIWEKQNNKVSDFKLQTSGKAKE